MRRRTEKLGQELRDHRQRLDHLELEVGELSKKNVQVSKVSNEWKEPIPVLVSSDWRKNLPFIVQVFVCNRPLAVRDHVQKLITYRPTAELFPIFVSQDCDNEEVRNKVMEFGDKVHYIKVKYFFKTLEIALFNAACIRRQSENFDARGISIRKCVLQNRPSLQVGSGSHILCEKLHIRHYHRRWKLVWVSLQKLSSRWSWYRFWLLFVLLEHPVLVGSRSETVVCDCMEW